MKKIITLLLSMLVAFCVNAQLTVGSIAPDFTFTDMNGKIQNLYSYLNAGKSVAIDASATWCGPCWSYHNTHTLRDFYNEQGPSGTNKAMVLFIEPDGKTTDADMKGTGSNTQGNWVIGTPYPMCNPLTGAALTDFTSGFKIPYYPTMYLICPDKKIALASTWSSSNPNGKVTFTNAELKAAMNSKCTTVSTGDLEANDNGILVYPSLSSGSIYISSRNSIDVLSIKIYNMVGSLLLETTYNNSISLAPIEISLNDFKNGIYVVNIQSNNSYISKKIALNK